jgi:hypothetical protein
MQTSLMVWNNDGHVINLRINKSELEIVGIECPHEGQSDKACQDSVYECLVKHFVGLYGMECNAGNCNATSSMQISWTLIGDTRVVDECQLWFMPNDDEVFSSWLKMNTDKTI